MENTYSHSTEEMMMLISVECDAVWDYKRTDSGQWLATCEVLHSVIQSETKEELVEDIQEAMQVLFLDLEESGELDRLAHEHGWTVQRTPLETEDYTESSGRFQVSNPVVCRSAHAHP